MDFVQIAAFIRPELFVIVAVCYLLGLLLKALPKIKDWLIPFIVLIFAIVLTILYIALALGEGFAAKVILEGFIQGFLCACVSVYGNEVIKQLTVKRAQDK